MIKIDGSCRNTISPPVELEKVFQAGDIIVNRCGHLIEITNPGFSMSKRPPDRLSSDPYHFLSLQPHIRKANSPMEEQANMMM